MDAPMANLPLNINIFVDKNDRNAFVAKVDRSLINKHSKTVKGLLEANPAKTDIVVKDAAKGPVEHVIEMMKRGKQPLRIGVGHEPFPKIIAILQAVNALDVEPPQPQVENHVIYAITQFKITAEQVFVIQEASTRLGKDGRIYKAMVQAVAYTALHEGFTVDEKKAVKSVAAKYPDLNNAIQDKVEELKRRGEAHEKMLEEKQARKAAREKKEAEKAGRRGTYYRA